MRYGKRAMTSRGKYELIRRFPARSCSRQKLNEICTVFPLHPHIEAHLFIMNTVVSQFYQYITSYLQLATLKFPSRKTERKAKKKNPVVPRQDIGSVFSRSSVSSYMIKHLKTVEMVDSKGIKDNLLQYFHVSSGQSWQTDVITVQLTVRVLLTICAVVVVDVHYLSKAENWGGTTFVP